MLGSTVNALRSIYSNSFGAKAFFDWASLRQKSASMTTIDAIERKSGMDRASCISFAKNLAEIGCGKFVIGRRGSKTRFVWHYGLKSIARAAVGQSEMLEPLNTDLASEIQDDNTDESGLNSTSFDANDALSISEAKRRLAISLGVTVESIEITIRS